MDTLPEAAPRGPEYRLFNSRAVGIAAFICCPLAGAILIAVNFGRLGKPGKGVLVVAFGMIATALNVVIKLNWATSPGSLEQLEYDAFEILFMACMWVCVWWGAKDTQGKAVKEHVARGGQLGTQAAAFGIGLATLAGLVIVVGAAVTAYQHRKIAVIGPNDQIAYSGFATKADGKLRWRRLFLEAISVLLDGH